MPNITWYAHSSTHFENNTCRINRKSFHTLVLFSFRILFIFLERTSIILYRFWSVTHSCYIAFVHKNNSIPKLHLIVLWKQLSFLDQMCIHSVLLNISNICPSVYWKNISKRTCNIKLERFFSRDWFVDRIILDNIIFLACMQCINIFSLLPSFHTCAHIYIGKWKVYFKKWEKR